MTKKELIEKIKNFPDDAIIEVYDGCSVFCTANEDIDTIEYDKLRNRIFIA